MSEMDLFKDSANHYDAYRQGYSAQAVNAIKCRTGFNVSFTVLDLACGTGLVLREFTDAQLLCGIDISMSMLMRGAEFHPDVLFTQAKGEYLPFFDAMFDLVVIGQAIHWFDLAALIPEIHRVLKPGGWLAVMSKYPAPGEPYRPLFEYILSLYKADSALQLKAAHGLGNILGLNRQGFSHYRRMVFEVTLQTPLDVYLYGCVNEREVRTLDEDQRALFREDLESALQIHASADGVLHERYYEYVITAQKNSVA